MSFALHDGGEVVRQANGCALHTLHTSISWRRHRWVGSPFQVSTGLSRWTCESTPPARRPADVRWQPLEHQQSAACREQEEEGLDVVAFADHAPEHQMHE